MNTYTIRIYNHIFNLTMAKAKAEKIQNALRKLTCINQYHLEKREGENYTMEYWSMSQKYSLTKDESDNIYNFFRDLPEDIKTKQYETILKSIKDKFNELVKYDYEIEELNKPKLKVEKKVINEGITCFTFSMDRGPK